MFRPRPWIAVDCVVFDRSDALLLVRRRRAPFKGNYALPGGFVERGETVEYAALRELKEESGIEGGNPRLVGVYSDPRRDPRRHVITIAFLIEPVSAPPKAGDDAFAAEFVSNWRACRLAFDHARIIEDALRTRMLSHGPQGAM